MKYLPFVNIKQGTASQRRFSNGNTLPLTALPHALAAFAPQTDGGRESWFYHPADRSFEGIRLTHQPSPWMGDFSYLCFMPESDGVFVSPDARWSGFRPEDARLNPHYLKINLLRYGAAISLAPTDTGAVMRVEYDDTVAVPRFAITPPQFDGEINIDIENRLISGYTTSKNGRPQREFKCYFVFKFSCAISDPYVTDGQKAFSGTEFSGVAAGANVALAEKNATVSMAISYVNERQALLNLSRDAAGFDFDAAKAHAEEEWESVLQKIEVSGDKEKMKTFYSCLYRAFLYPTKFYEIDDLGNRLHVNPENGEIEGGVMYTNNGFWDTFRTVYPLYSLIAPEKCTEIIQGYLNFFDDTGYLPRWPSPSESGGMPGTLIEAVLGDAVVKGLLDKKDSRRALNAMLKNAEVQSDKNAQGRKCVAEYGKIGYVPYDKCWESVNETLDCAYGDYCIAAVAEKLAETEIARKYYTRSKNYSKLFDKDSGFMRARDSKGNFRNEPFDCFAWGRDYTEGSAWQTSVSVQHDMNGLAELYGGNEKYVEFIDKLFAAPPRYSIGGYGGEIHEMTEMAAADFGQCAISNQPSFHIPYIYAELGYPEKSKAAVKYIVDKAFSSADDGFPGDEDNGTMAAWYIFSTMGFYPFCPSRDDYLVTAPLFDKIILHAGKDIDVIELLKNKKRIRQRDFYPEHK